MLNVPRIGVLRAVARHGSFSGAADALGYTQPAVSRQIATLEAETGAVLVTRAADGARMTEAGEVLVRHAETIFGALDEAETELRAVLGLEAGRLRLAAFSIRGREHHAARDRRVPGVASPRQARGRDDGARGVHPALAER